MKSEGERPETEAAEPDPPKSGGRYGALKERYQNLVAEFGTIAIVTHFSVGLLVYLTFAALIQAGVDVEGAAEGSGVLASAWVAYKLTFPVRVMVTIGLTPIVAAIYYRVRGGSRPEPAPVVAPGDEGPKPAET